MDPSEIAIDPPRTFQRERWRGWNTSAATTSSSRRALDGGNVARRCPSQREWFESSMSSGCTGRAQEEHCFHSPGGSARGKGFLVVECEWCKGDAAARIQVSLIGGCFETRAGRGLLSQSHVGFFIYSGDRHSKKRSRNKPFRSRHLA